MIKSLYAAAVAVAFVPAAAMGGEKTASGSINGMSWTAKSTIVGQTGTGTAAAVPPGNPIYLGAANPAYSGVVGLRMQYASGAFVCTGSLLRSGQILTAGHCVSDGKANDVNGRSAGLISTTAYFYDGVSQGADPFYYPSGGVLQPGITAVEVSAYNIHAGYTGEVIDQNDIAVLTLASAAPSYAVGYDLYTGGDLTGATFNVTGIGTRSITGGADGTTGAGAGAGPGRFRQGNNVYDYNWGHDAFADLFTTYDPECDVPAGSDPDGGTNWFCGYADIEYSYISDFDRSGFAANSTACRTAAVFIGSGAAIANGFCTNGVGALEVGIAGGDSGGAAFIDGKIASVNSYGLTFGTGVGDYKAGLNNSWGEFNGYVPTFIHAAWIASVPEPSTWALLILGFGVAGGAMRRKNRAEARFAF